MKLKIALVGLGQVAQDNYLPFLAEQEGVALGLYNRTQEKTARLANQYGATAFTDLNELVRWEPATALVLTSETCRFEFARELIEKGVPRLFFEKPLVAAKGQAHVSEEDFLNGRMLLELAAKHHCETAMIFNYRFFQQTIAAKKVARERGFGEVIHAVAQVHYACWSHCIDLIRHFAGNVVAISALAGVGQRRSEEAQMSARDIAAAFRMENGATGTILGTAGMDWQHPLYELVLTFERGRLHLRDVDGTLEILDRAGDVHETRSLTRHTSRWAQYVESFGASLRAYLDSLRSGTAPPVPGLDGLRELQFEAALQRSIAEQREIGLAKEFPL
jgi:predicted dehydrogenase